VAVRAGLVAGGEHVLGDRRVRAPDLLGPGEGRLARRQLEHGPVAERHQLVGAVQRRRVGGDAQLGAHPGSVDRDVVAAEPLEVVLVQTPAGEDLHVCQPGLVEQGAGPAGQRGQVALVATAVWNVTWLSRKVSIS
jgi:hypothetical protein